MPKKLLPFLMLAPLLVFTQRSITFSQIVGDLPMMVAAWKDLKEMEAAGTLEDPESPQGLVVVTTEEEEANEGDDGEAAEDDEEGSPDDGEGT